jgi:hypothetical protein
MCYRPCILAVAMILLSVYDHTAAGAANGPQWTVCDTQAVDYKSAKVLSPCASTQELADSLNNHTGKSAGSVLNICHGEDETICNLHPGYVPIFEQCGDANGVGGANPAVSAQHYCSDPKNYTAWTEIPGTDGGHCGYSWFHLNCR